jgi:cell cycle sensor histidine kinase DivJ
VSHELRTPLNAIIGFSELLASDICGTLPDPRQREYVALIHESGSHLLTVVNDILDMSKIEAGKLELVVEPFAVEDMVKATQRMVAQLAAERGLTLAAEIAPGLPDLAADPRACRQILINLLSNAIKFTERGGRVHITAMREGGFIAIGVADTGIGIAEADVARLGEPFVQARGGYDRRHAGTGLGLSVVKGLTALHGGAMRIESRLGVGTTVTVRLPIDGPATTDVAAPPAGGRVVPLADSETAGRAGRGATARTEAEDSLREQRQRRA